MKPPDVIPSDKFGKLTVIEEAAKRGNQRYFRVRCDCGKVTEVRRANLICGKTKSCGCNRAPAPIAPGTKCGMLTVLHELPRRDGVRYFKTRCDCGGIKEIRIQHLKSRGRRSCGCLTEARRRKVEIGERFGRLTVIREAAPRGGRRYFEVICDCPRQKTKIVELSKLTTGRTISCGCAMGRERIPVEIGARYGALVIIEELPDRVDGAGRTVRRVQVRCEACNRELPMAWAQVRNRNTSCGCVPSKRRISVIGKRIGTVVVIAELPDYVSPTGKVRRRVRVKCDCGTTAEKRLEDLLSRPTRSCGCIPKRKRMGKPITPGEQYGKLTVLREVESTTDADGRKRRRVEVECTCGNKFVRYFEWLSDESSCKCSWRTAKRDAVIPGAVGRAKALCKYKESSRKRGFSFSLTEEEFFELLAAPCVYCGRSNTRRVRDNVGGGGFECNGIDRIDSERGYETGNVEPCCWTCNDAKGKQDRDEFRLHLAALCIGHASGWQGLANVVLRDDQEVFGAHEPTNRFGRPKRLLARNVAYSSHKCRAAKEGHVQELSREQFTALVLSPCFYCGARSSREVKSQSADPGVFRCNSIDRIDSGNGHGYSLDNVVPACKFCNFAKRAMSFHEFAEHVWLIDRNLRLSGRMRRPKVERPDFSNVLAP